MEKTIKQIADEYGLTKQAIRARIKKLSKDCYQVTDKGTILVNKKGQKALEEALLNRSIKKGGNVDDNIVDTLIKQLHTKDEQIERLQKALDQAQQLQALAENKIRQLEDKQKQPEYKPEQVEEPKKKFWFWNK